MNLPSTFLLFSLLAVSFIPSMKAISEAPSMQWQQFFDGNRGYSVLQTEDGGYAVAGISASTSLLIRTDSVGNLLWVKAYQIGGKETNLPYLVQTKDGGYTLGGTWENRFALIKVDSEGNTQWNKTYEYPAPSNYLRSFIQTSDGGYALVGTFSTPQNITHVIGQIWFVKADALGNVQWNKTIVGPLGNFANSVLQTIDGGYAIIGTSWAFQVVQTQDGGYAFTGVLNGKDAWVLKTDANGDADWSLTFAGSSFVGSSTEDFGKCIIQTNDGGYALVGTKDGKIWLAKISPSTNPASIWFPTEVVAAVVVAIILIVTAAIIVRKRRHSNI
jgi:hypothetical protein